MPDSTLVALDFFCGLGGLSYGISEEGVHVAFANDLEEPQAATYKLNHPRTTVDTRPIEELSSAGITRLSGAEPRGVDLICGGPPCQGFSTYGQRRLDDRRNWLFREFARLIGEFKPHAILMENVVGLLSMDKGMVVNEIVGTFQRELGFQVTVMVLDAVNFGVPQNRKRVFIIGGRGFKPSFPVPTHRSSPTRPPGSRYVEEPDLFHVQETPERLRNQNEYDAYLKSAGARLQSARTVRDAISDLPEDAFPPSDSAATCAYPNPPQSEYQAMMREGASSVSNHSAKRHLFRRLMRTALLDPGDYGTAILDRLKQRGAPDEVIELIKNKTLTKSALAGIRNVDKAIEGELLELAEAGSLDKATLVEKIKSAGFANKYRRLKWNQPSHTLVAHMARDCSDFIHPSLNRPISVREAARLQSFPDKFTLASSQFRQLRGIGNAVPPLMSRAVVRNLLKDLAVHLSTPPEGDHVTRASVVD